MTWLHRYSFFVFAVLCFIRNSSLFKPKQHSRAKASRRLFGALRFFQFISSTLSALVGHDMSAFIRDEEIHCDPTAPRSCPVRARCLQLLQKLAICPFSVTFSPWSCAAHKANAEGLCSQFFIFPFYWALNCKGLREEMRSHSMLIWVTHVTLTKLTLKMERSAIVQWRL